MKILMVCYGGAHVALVIPLYRELVSRDHECVMIGLTTAGPVLEREGIVHKRVIDYVDMKNDNIQKYGRELLGKHHTDGIGITEEESIAYLGISFAESVKTHGEQKARDMYNEHGLASFLPVEFMTSVLETEMPDVVLATDSPRMERAALNSAVNLGIPSVCSVVIFPHIGMHYLSRQDNGSIMCVCNSTIKEQLVDAGRSPESVIVTGNPSFEKLFSAPENLRETVRSSRGLSDQSKLVLWADQPEPANPELPRLIRSRLNEVCLSIKNCSLLVRLHPSSTDPAKEPIPETAMLSPREEPLINALLAADIVVTCTSTVAYEALLLGKPVIILQMSQYDKYVDYSEDVGALVLNSTDKLKEGLEELISEKSPRAQKLKKNRIALAEESLGACEKIVAIIESLSNKN
ncbi:MAG: UDP-N-acetyl glucosamine 2-epimerase [Candidatus Nitronauta litoralis]|uniref:UDP-N-acetyl glucosamine 2-epimerase n=1 Tax=Candidatus Nitronauta litoralis TaxID=2705533 RepID=A0A7T0G0K2_9BACT|nr:MAG: UDP-N-acetyl glucosamine 2-epimerase [Candidatus Nitronauta litoralis]